MCEHTREHLHFHARGKESLCFVRLWLQFNVSFTGFVVGFVHQIIIYLM